jgi:phosphatidylglycerophosphate synthase
VLTVRSSPAVGLTALVALLAALELTWGLSDAGWVVGLTCGVVLNAVVARGLARGAAGALGPADLVTLTRATLTCGVAALTADVLLERPVVTGLLALTVPALVLDAVDGWVARRTRTASVFGARFDGEADAFLILVLSVSVARMVGEWVLAIGAARYAFAMAGWGWPWLRVQLPFRYWRKVVAATQGIVLTLAAAQILPRSVTITALVVALALLAESFGRDVWWLWRIRLTAQAAEPAGGRKRRAVAVGVTNALALLLVWFALVAPNETQRLSLTAFLRIPVEGLVVAGLALVLPSRARRMMAALVGVLLALLTVLKILDMGFSETLHRPFNLVTDRAHFASAFDFVRESVGPAPATAAVLAAVLLAAAVLVGTPLAVGRLTRLLTRHHHGSARAVTGLAAVWIMCAVSGLQIADNAPIASTSAGRLAVSQVRMTATSLGDQQRFDEVVAIDHLREPANGELAELRGKDVLLVFVESYGRVAVEGSPSSQVQAVLDGGTRRLQAHGYSAKSAFLTSPTFGGTSWLAHATLQSGLWVDNQWEYDRLLSSGRTTLNRAFGRGGWRTVAVLPSNREAWPEGKAYYGFDTIYDSSSFGYAGPGFGFSKMPDQFALGAFQHMELDDRSRSPVMAEIDLTSSHAPWAPLPSMVDWETLGDGSVFDHIHGQAEPAHELWRHRENVPAAYMKSIEYSLLTLVSFVEKYGDDNLVLILLGDHQPATVVSSHARNHDVPITVIARDPAVINAISGWGWQDGMRPGSAAPVWPMDAFRDRFLSAYSSRAPGHLDGQRVSTGQP